MVVCKCRKATKLYCFVHKVPVCGECICFPEHQICVVRTYSEWVIDGEYDWPPTCCLCQMVLEDGNDHKTTRLGCMHVIHTNCLVSHLKCFPQNTAPAGYICPTCSTPIWPPKNIKDSGSAVHSRLREVIMQEWAAGGAFLNPLVASYKKISFLEASAEKRKNVETGLEKNLLGNSNVIFTSAEHHGPPPAFASDPLQHISDTGSNQKNDANPLDSMRNLGLSSSVAQELNYKSAVYPPATGVGSSKLSTADNVEIDNTSSMENQLSSDNGLNFLTSANSASNASQPGAATRKVVHHFDRQNSEISYYADDEDATQKKYIRRGPLRHKFLRSLLPFWSSALPTLPVTAPPRKGMANADDASEGRARHPRSSRMDPRKILILMALMACMATMAILYYRLAQRSIDENRPREEQH